MMRFSLQAAKEGVKAFLLEKRYGFYVCAATAFLSVIAAVVYGVYGASPSGAPYFSWVALLVLLAGAAGFFAADAFRATRRYAPAILAAGGFIAFLCFINDGFCYFSVVFYSGVNAEAFASMNGGFAASLILFLLVFLTGSVALYLPQEKKTEEEVAPPAPPREKRKKAAPRASKPVVRAPRRKREKPAYGMSAAEEETARYLSERFETWEEK